MLKKRIKALGIAAAMLVSLLPCMSVNAAHHEILEQTRAVINEDFDSYSEEQVTLSTSYMGMTASENIQVKKYMSWTTTKAEILAAGKSGNGISIDMTNGAAIKLKNTEGATPISLGDVIHINFDTAHSGPGARMNLNINENPSAKFALKYYYDGRWINNFAAEPMILGMYYDNNGNIVPSTKTYNGIPFPVDTWKNVDVVIDTQDEEYEGAQTIKVSVDGVYHWCGTYDANYTGEGDTTIDPFTTFTSLNFDSNGNYASAENVVKYDNVKVEITQIPKRIETRAVIDEDFNSYAEDRIKLTNDYVKMLDNVSVKKNDQWDGYAGISEIGKTGSAVYADISNGLSMKIDNSEGVTALGAGDSLNINFDVNYTIKSARMRVNINDNPGAKFVLKEYSDWINNFAGSTEARLANLFFDSSKIAISDNAYGGADFQPETWTNVDIVINTYDEKYNAQTLKITVGDVWYYGTYDANYTGEGDTTVDPFTSFSSLDFYCLNGFKDGVGNIISVDNIKVEVTQPVIVPTVISDIKTHIVDVDFENLEVKDYKGNNANSAKAITDNFAYNDAWSSATAKVSEDAEKGKVWEIPLKDGGLSLSIVTPDEDVTISEGDEVIMSFDYKFSAKNAGETAKNKLYALVNGTVLWQEGQSAKYYPNVHYKNDEECTTYKEDYFASRIFGIEASKLRVGFTNHYDAEKDASVLNISPDTWYNIKFIIKTKDRDFAGAQTLTTVVTDGTDTWRGIGRYETDGTQYLETLKNLAILSEYNSGEYSAYYDNFNIDVVKPSFEISGDAVSGLAPTEFTPGESFVVDCAAAAKYYSAETLTMYYAQYKEGVLSSVELVPVSFATGAEHVIETQEFDVDSDTTMVKIFLWKNDSLAPSLDCYTMTAKN